MVQVTFDTAKDTVGELEASLRILQDAIARRKGTPHMDMPAATPADPASQPDEETAIDTPFLKITVKNDKHEETPDAEQEIPSLNQLLSDDKITEEQLSHMFKEHGGTVEEETDTPQEKERKDPDPSYIEIVEYTDEKD